MSQATLTRRPASSAANNAASIVGFLSFAVGLVIVLAGLVAAVIFVTTLTPTMLIVGAVIAVVASFAYFVTRA